MFLELNTELQCIGVDVLIYPNLRFRQCFFQYIRCPKNIYVAYLLAIAKFKKIDRCIECTVRISEGGCTSSHEPSI
jgi:hypothetical protein